MTDKSYTKIPNRGQILISGEKAGSFLQGIITNDINILNRQKMIYSCLLSPQGKILHDFFISKENSESYKIECEGNERLVDLKNILNRYKLRIPINITSKDNIDVYQINEENGDDPRMAELGSRTYNEPENMKENPFDSFQELMRSLCVPNGSEDLEIQRYHPLECNMDKLNAISFNKGCYVGQELVSRVKNRGLLKKRLQSIKIGNNFKIEMRKIENKDN